MAIYESKGRKYEVEDITLGGMCIQVNGTTITDCDRQADLLGYAWQTRDGSFSVFVDSDERAFGSFDEAYRFAMERQKDTFSI